MQNKDRNSDIFAEIEIEYDYSSAGKWANEAAQRFFSSAIPTRPASVATKELAEAVPTQAVKPDYTQIPARPVTPAHTTILMKSSDSTILTHTAGLTIPQRQMNTAVTAARRADRRLMREAVDPKRAKFAEMRLIAGKYPFFVEENESFYKQAKFMEDFSDDYSGDAKYTTYYPHYMHMGYEQLRTYFTWRTKVRQGDIIPTSISYAFVYIFELICNVGVDSYADGLNKIVEFWKSYKNFTPSLERFLPQWIKDYHIYYELPHEYAEFVKENGLQQYYRKAFLFFDHADDIFMQWSAMSSYKITDSRFYRDGNEELVKRCTEAVIHSISKFCDSLGINLDTIFYNNVRKGIIWKPFQRAIFYDWHKQPDRKVTLPGNEEYFCANNQWTANIPIRYRNVNDIVGYILKKTESSLRSIMKYKYPIKADPNKIESFFGALEGQGITSERLDIVISDTVGAFYSEWKRIVVVVNKENLVHIREEARGTREKLTVEDENTIVISRSSTLSVGLQAFSPTRPHEDWSVLRESLNGLEIEVLRLITQGVADSDIKEVALERGIMLEVLASGINEKAVDTVGDSILDTEDGLRIYPEYNEKTAEMVMSNE